MFLELVASYRAVETHPIVITLSVINFIIITIFFIVYLLQHIHLIIALFTKNRKWDNAKSEHTFGILIAGRNEELVIANLIDSIKNQDYPSDKIKIYVCADNCTDNTASVARDHGAIVYERFNDKLIGKSYAMDYLIENVKKDEYYNKIDAFLVFDADNLLSKTYIKEMNKTLDAGYEVSTSFRESKNLKTNLVSACSGLTFYRECLLVHHSRSKLGLGTYVSGTGYMVSKRIINNLDGWNFNTMTEDIEFSIWCATNDITITYNSDALFYDEQPESLSIANTQRLRWCKGTHQCCYNYDKLLLEKMFKGKNKITCFELFSHVTPFPIISIGWLFIYLTTSIILYFTGIETLDHLIHVVLSNVGGVLFFLIIVTQIQGFVSLIKNKHIKLSLRKKLLYSFMFPFYVIMYIPLSFIALFKRVKWKKIPHTSNVRIESFD